MTYLRHGLIAAATLLAATHSSVLAAEPPEGVHVAVNEVLLHPGRAQTGFQYPPMPAQRFLPSGRDDPEPADPGTIQGKAAGIQLGLKDAVLASHAVQSLKGIEFGLGLANDTPVNGFMGWYGVYLQSLDRVAERNTIYGLLRETPRPGFNNSKAPTAFCCQRSDTLTSLEQFASTITTREVSPTFFLFGLLRKKGWNLNLDDGWKLQAGIRDVRCAGRWEPWPLTGPLRDMEPHWTGPCGRTTRNCGMLERNSRCRSTASAYGPLCSSSRRG